jgi:hypothetical protein
MKYFFFVLSHYVRFRFTNFPVLHIFGLLCTFLTVFSVSDQDSYCPLVITKRIVKKDLNSTDCPFYRVPEHGSFII